MGMVARFTVHEHICSPLMHKTADCLCNNAPTRIEVGDTRLPLLYLWVNVHKGDGISGRGHYIVCSSVMLGTACTA